MSKYSGKEFNDPIVRCADCQTLLFRTDIQKLGMCKKCGTRRVKNVLILSGEEMDYLVENGVDPEFLDLFREVDHAA